MEPTRDELCQIENSSDFISVLFNSSFMVTLLTLYHLQKNFTLIPYPFKSA